jgi:thioredoxin reductase (NADPH)
MFTTAARDNSPADRWIRSTVAGPTLALDTTALSRKFGGSRGEREGGVPGNQQIVVYGTTWCADCKRTKQFLGEQRVAYSFVDVDTDPAAMAYVEEVNQGRQVIPVVRFPDGDPLVEPSNAELAQRLGLRTAARNRFYDLVIVGSGPAGLTAALYAAREGIDTLVVERAAVGGQAGVTERLDNFPGFPEGVSGADFADRLRAQAERFGVEILTAQSVTGVTVDGDYRVVATESAGDVCGYAVLLALGSTYRRLGVPGEEDFIGAGVHYCATCDGAFYRGRDVLVVGGGNSAGEESIFLTRFSPSVTIATIDPALTASRVVREKVAENPAITVLPCTTVAEFRGDSRLRSVLLRDSRTGQTTEAHPDGVFVFIGLTPNTDVVAGLVDLDDVGFIVTDVGLQTSAPGVFAAGDCRAGSTKQAASAAGEGAAAALAVRRYVEPLTSGMQPHADATDGPRQGTVSRG